MKFADSFQKWISWTISFIVYCLSAVIIFAMFFAFSKNNVDTNVADCESETAIRRYQGKATLQITKEMVACLEEKNGVLENLQIRKTINTINALPNAPCKYVGEWISIRPDCRYLVTLREDGEFVSAPLSCSAYTKTYRGVWGVHENQMAWLEHSHYIWPLDINLIVAEGKNSFSLVEVNGSRTIFVRTEAPDPATNCAKLSTENAAEIAVE